MGRQIEVTRAKLRFLKEEEPMLTGANLLQGPAALELYPQQS